MWVLAVCAFLTFRGIIKGSFLTNYSYTDPVCNFMRCLFAVAQTLTYPIELFVARHSIHAIAFPAQRWTDQQHYLITLLLWGSSLAIALNVADLGAVLEITGGIAAVSIGFLLPALLHFKMTPELNWKVWRNKPSKRAAACREFAPSYFIFVVGCFAMFFTVVAMVDELSSGGHEPHDAFDPVAAGDQSGVPVAGRGGGFSSGYDLEAWGRALAAVGARALARLGAR
jgi:sodium-coupled neutral amino acid transporter 11